LQSRSCIFFRRLSLRLHFALATLRKVAASVRSAASFAGGELLGPLHHESYAHVDEVKGDRASAV